MFFIVWVDAMPRKHFVVGFEQGSCREQSQAAGVVEFLLGD